MIIALSRLRIWYVVIGTIANVLVGEYMSPYLEQPWGIIEKKKFQ
jgi:hypothetical protein